MATPAPYSVRDYQFDYTQKRFTITSEMLPWTTQGGTNPSTPTLGFSIGSPTFTQVLNGRFGGAGLEATTDVIDVLWAIPRDIDNRQAIYVRHRWVYGGVLAATTPTAQFRTLYDTMAASGTFVSGTTLLTVPSSPSSTIQPGLSALTLTTRQLIAPLATGTLAGQTLAQDTEYIKFSITAASVNWSIGATLPAIWLGMDLEYTPRQTFGDGSHRPARKMETTLGDSEIGAANQY